MPVLKITNFGGLMPKAQPRALPDASAQTATNLQGNTSEFRPLAADTTVVATISGGVSNPLSLYRFQRNSDGSLNTVYTSASNWLASAADKNYVKCQVNNDTTDRTLVSFNDGSAAPRMIDATGSDRQLGVPKPTVAATITVNASDEFTTDERSTALQAALQTAVTAVRASATAVYRGAARPGTGTDGYLDRTATNGFSPIDQTQMVRVYKLNASGGVISDSFTAIADTNFTWAFDPQLSGVRGDSIASSPSWALPAGTHFICLPFAAYGLTYDIDSSALSTALTAILMPGKTDGTKLFTPTQVTNVVADLVDYVDPAGPTVKPLIDSLAAKVTELKELLDGGSRASLAASTQAFYGQADVAAAITAAKANFADAVFAMADGIARSSLPDDYGNQGAGA